MILPTYALLLYYCLMCAYRGGLADQFQHCHEVVCVFLYFVIRFFFYLLQIVFSLKFNHNPIFNFNNPDWRMLTFSFIFRQLVKTYMCTVCSVGYVIWLYYSFCVPISDYDSRFVFQIKSLNTLNYFLT